MRDLIKQIRKDLEKNIDLKYKLTARNFFKKDDQINLLGVRSPVIRKIASKYFKILKEKNISKKEIFDLCEELLNSKIHEELVVAFQFAEESHKYFVKDDFITFKRWIEFYVTNWASCDDLCCGAFGDFLVKFPEFIKETRKWSESKNRWLKRASIVGLIRTVQKTKKTNDVYIVADLLLDSKDDLIHKATGWTLREAGKVDEKRLFNYIMKNKHKMPRTALRYSIERMNKEMKIKAMG